MIFTPQDEFFFLKEGQWYQTDESWMDKIMKWFSPKRKFSGRFTKRSEEKALLL